MAKIRAGVGLLIAAALLFAPRVGLAQDDSDEAETSETGEEAGLDDLDALDETGEPSSLDELCEIDPENCVKVDMDEYAKRELDPDMYAVQQIYALRARRFEINPYVALTMNDQFVSHPGGGLGLNYYIYNWFGVGLNANVYGNAQSDFNFETSRAARIGQPITEYLWNANANVTFVPAYGKFGAFKSFIFHYDFYFTAGGGAISTRPIAVVDPDNRTFDYNVTWTVGAAFGMRIFFTRYLAAMLEIRDYIFMDTLENPTIASGLDSRGIPLAQDPATWTAPDLSFTNNVQAQLGLSFFFPMSWEYRLPK